MQKLKALAKFLLQDLNMQMKDQLAMDFLAPLYDSYLPWSDSAMRPSGLKKVLNEIIIYQRKSIVECGGGISTLFIAKILSQYGGHLYTIDHDEAWVEILKTTIGYWGLDQYVSIILAPMAASDLSLNGLSWYDTTAISPKMKDVAIDFLVVDGPLAYAKGFEHARYPALPYFLPHFTPDFSVVLDDIGRNGEKDIIQRWSKLAELEFKQYEIDGGIALGRSKQRFWI
jgi:hypothetical protein